MSVFLYIVIACVIWFIGMVGIFWTNTHENEPFLAFMWGLLLVVGASLWPICLAVGLPIWFACTVAQHLPSYCRVRQVWAATKKKQ